MKKHLMIIGLVIFISVGFISASAEASMTMVTFSDPSLNSMNPLFTVDFHNNSLTGGWDDVKTGLTLKIPYNGNTFFDAWFDMTPVSIDLLGNTGSGTINFYENNAMTPLVTINFQSGYVSRFGFGSEDDEDEFVADIVTIAGSEITNQLSDEQFAFSFANKKKLSGAAGLAGGFTTTAAFTSSAIVGTAIIPEPATIVMLGLGALSLIRRKK